jgi:hypothetical protein
MDTRTLSFESIYYKRAVYDEGVILGKRPWKWTLGNKYSPCNARRVDNNLSVSTFSPHKQNFSVYISRHTIQTGDTYKIVNHEYGKDRIESVLKVIEIGLNWCKVDVLEEKTVKYESKKKYLPPEIVPDGKKPLLFTKEWEQEENRRELTTEQQANFEELLSFFSCVQDESNNKNDSEALPGKVSPGVREEVSEDSPATSSTRIMCDTNFVNGKNQIGFGFIMMNEGKLQQSLFALPDQRREEVTREEPRQQETPAMIQAKPTEPKPVKIAGFSNEEIAILDAIGKGAEHIDGIIQKSGLQAGMVAGMLLMLEMKDHVKQKPGRYFIRI